MHITKCLQDLYEMNSVEVSVRALDLARFSLFDWCVCGIAGAQEPVARKLRSYIAHVKSPAGATVFGGGAYPSVQAALANGSISHALDYDDTHFAHIGHLSVGIFPAAIAIAQERDASLQEVVEAFLLGAEAAIRLGLVLGTDHYLRGFHQTATAGAFGATLAASRLLGLSTDHFMAAIGLCSTRASGLKNQFGTMGKPLNAGFAASNGVECAQLASLGVTSATDGLGGDQGFIATHAELQALDIGPTGFLFEDVRYKLHACCHGTHAMLEALGALVVEHRISPVQLRQVCVYVHPKWLDVCDVKQPCTGLQVKFSYAWLAAMAMHGFETADPAAFQDTLCSQPDLQSFAQRVTVLGDANLPDTAVRVTLQLDSAQILQADHDLMNPVPAPELAEQLRKKGRAVIGSQADDMWCLVSDQQSGSARDLTAFMAE